MSNKGFGNGKATLDNGYGLFLSMLSYKLSDVVCVESLNMRAMSNKGFGNGKATLDNGYGLFLSMLSYKLSDRKKYFIKVDKWFPSSQRCHYCGRLHPEMKDISVRTIECDCGVTMSRDQNAAIIKVDKWFPSSQRCHYCGRLHPEMKDISVRTIECDCGVTMSRDQNAAINIKKEGLRILKSVA